MYKITFIGAGSTVFVKNIMGDCILTESLGEFEIALFDIDHVRLNDSKTLLNNLNAKYNGKAHIVAYTDRKKALNDAKFVINAIQVGGYEPCTVIDFEIPKKFGLRQTIGDTLGVGGIFRAMRTAYVLEDIAKDMAEVCPNALFLNYTNPMGILTGYMQRYLHKNTIGLCHSVQVCVSTLLESLGLKDKIESAKSVIAGINHQAWLLEVKDENGQDLYPEIKRRSKSLEYCGENCSDLVRFEIMNRFGYYNTESSEHTAEYSQYFIKDKYPELIEKFRIPLDEYPRRCVNQIEQWKEMRGKLVNNTDIEHTLSREYGAKIINSVVNNVPYSIHGNVINNGSISNLPSDACVEVACLVDRNGISPTIVGKLPEQCAALNRTNLNVQLMAIEAIRSRKLDAVYQAVYLDPHTSSELSFDKMKEMCDELFVAHKDWLPKYN